MKTAAGGEELKVMATDVLTRHQATTSTSCIYFEVLYVPEIN